MKFKYIIVLLSIVFLLFIAYFFLGKQTAIAPVETPVETSSEDSISQEISSYECNGIPTPLQAEGPYYKSGSPKRVNIVEGIPGEKLIVTGFVFDENCNTIANAWLDFWQADASGVYDTSGYNLRGHQFTDENGFYRLETIVPSAYGSRPAHIHVKVRPPDGETLTSQMYFPSDPQNQTDSIFDKELIMNIKEGENGMLAEFNFVLN